MLSDSKKRIKARHEWLNDIVNRWETASGVSVPNERVVRLAKELDDRNYPETIARLAEEWILRGESIKYGRLHLAAFYPTLEQIESLGGSIDRILARERAEGMAQGFAEGKVAGFEQFSQDLRYLEVLSRTRRIRNYAQRVKVIRAMEIANDNEARRVRKERYAVLQIRNRIMNRLRELHRFCCPIDRDLINNAVRGLE